MDFETKTNKSIYSALESDVLVESYKYNLINVFPTYHGVIE